jgi:glycosyltransferase involved in cell wall biosynthesis
MRVGVFIGGVSADDGGGNTFCTGIVNALEGLCSQHQFILCQPNTNNHPTRTRVPFARRLAGRLSTLGPRVRFDGLRLQREATAICFEEHCVRNFEIDIAWFLAPRTKPISAPYIATVWDLEHRRQPYFPEVSTTGWRWEDREQNYRRLLPRAARVITGTSAGKKEIVAFYGVDPDNVHVVPFPAGDGFFDVSPDMLIDVRQKYQLSKAFILYPAQFWPHKNHVNLLLALRLLNSDADNPLQLVLTGSDKGNLDHIKKTALQLGVSQEVRILGFVSRQDLISLYHQSVGLVFPSFFGPDNLPPLEAFAIGCPVAAARVAGADEQLGDAAILFNPADPTEIAMAVRRMHDNAELRAVLIRRGRELVATRTPRNYVARISDIIDELESIRRCWGANYP